MEIVSPLLPATTLRWQPRVGHWAVTVICKATFQLLPNESKLAPDQDSLVDADRHWDDDPLRSVIAATDMVPVKRRVDVVLVGHAFSPAGQKVRLITVRVRVGSIDKAIGIIADRAVGADGTITEERGFSRMSIVYERAAGGPGTSNPVGRHRGHAGSAQLPNLLALQGSAGDPSPFGEPVGLGPIAPSWPQRRALPRAPRPPG